MTKISKRIVPFCASVSVAAWFVSYKCAELTPVGPSGIAQPSWMGFVSAFFFLLAAATTAATVVMGIIDLSD